MDFGYSKSDSEIEFIADILKNYDVVAIQEVVAGYGGAQAVTRLNDELNRKGSKWDYVVSDPTSGGSYKRERYAFLWKTSQLKRVGNPWLENHYNQEIDREPFFMTFQNGSKQFTLVTFHAITKTMQPETEIKYFKFMPALYPDKLLIFSGDFNLPCSHTVFNPLKSMGWKSILENQKTSLKQECVLSDCLASEFDNVFYPTKYISLIKSGVVHFYRSFPSLKDARVISDHIPIFMEFNLN